MNSNPEALVYLAFQYGEGGAPLSMLALVKSIPKNRIIAVVGDEGHGSIYRNEGYNSVHLAKPARVAKWPSRWVKLQSIISDLHPRVILACGYEEVMGSLLMGTFLRGVPVIGIYAGGEVPIFRPGMPARLIVFSEELKDGLVQRHGFDPNRVRVLANRIGPEYFNYTGRSGRLRELLSLAPDDFIVVAATRLVFNRIKGVSQMTRAVEELANKDPKIKLVIFGDGPYKEEMDELARDTNRRIGRETVFLPGYQKDISSFFADADLVLGVGRGVMEPLAMGIPAIVVGEKGMAGVFDPENAKELYRYNMAGRNCLEEKEPSELARAIGKIMEDKTYRESLSTFAREASRKYWCSEGAGDIIGVEIKAVLEGRFGAREKMEALYGFLVTFFSMAFNSLKLRLAAGGVRTKRKRSLSITEKNQ